VTPSQTLYASHYSGGTLTLSITGHTHLIQLPGGTQHYGNFYGATQAYEIITGIAGAPLDAGPYYGFWVHQRRLGDGAIVTQAYEALRGQRERFRELQYIPSVIMSCSQTRRSRVPLLSVLTAFAACTAGRHDARRRASGGEPSGGRAPVAPIKPTGRFNVKIWGSAISTCKCAPRSTTARYGRTTRSR
jgi:hypothetical protein